jgi:hypothetical protein
MADAPCTGCDEGYSGKAFVAYVNYYDDQELQQCRLRLCMNCIADHFLTLVSNADRRNERRVWITRQEYDQCRTDVRTDSTPLAPLVAVQSDQTNGTTHTFLEAEANKTTRSAPNAGSKPRAPQSPSSRRSTTSDSEPSPHTTQSRSSENTSSSASTSRSTSGARARTKSNGG